MTIDERQAVRVAWALPADQLALIGCGIATGADAAMFTAQVVPGSSVAVVGCGGVVQAVIQGARLCHAARMVAIDPVELKREVSVRSGAADTLAPDARDVVDLVRELTGGRGVDYAFEVVGSPAPVTTAYWCARRGGTAVTVGIPTPGAMIELPAADFFRGEERRRLVLRLAPGARRLPAVRRPRRSRPPRRGLADHPPLLARQAHRGLCRARSGPDHPSSRRARMVLPADGEGMSMTTA
jgi:Zn-dependent alcohol dehydrogenase